MSIKALSWAFEANIPSSGAKLTLLALANYADADDCTAYPSQKTISKITSLSTRAIRDHIVALEEMGFIERSSRKRDNGTFTSDLFVLKIDSNGIGNNSQRKFSPQAENAENQRQISQNPAADFARQEPLLNTTIKTEPIKPSAFDEFWEIYPKAVAKKKCLEMWKKRNYDAIAETILDDVRRKSKTEDWTKEGGKYAPMSTTYINQERWNDKPTQAPQRRERGVSL